MIPQEMIPAMQGVVPAVIATCSPGGEPNIAIISQVFYVDENHVAISFQFFNKTARNIRDNPRAYVLVINPEDGIEWGLDVEFVRSETEGRLFEEMDMQLEAIASAHGMAGIFKLKAADVYAVRALKRLER